MLKFDPDYEKMIRITDLLKRPKFLAKVRKMAACLLSYASSKVVGAERS